MAATSSLIRVVRPGCSDSLPQRLVPEGGQVGVALQSHLHHGEQLDHQHGRSWSNTGSAPGTFGVMHQSYAA
jgi:hypothetical protein